MLQQEIHQYLENFFEATQCTILENGPGFLTVQLTIEMDKELMNRPFYWTYLEKTGGILNPGKLTFITDEEKAPENVKGEYIHFGAPRLHQLFHSAKKMAAYIRLYEQPNPPPFQSVPLYPWLNVNLKISYRSDRKRDVLKSFGLHLINGMLVDHFHEKMQSRQLVPKIPDYCFTISPIIKPGSGLKRIDAFVKNEIAASDHSWAVLAKKRQEEDLNLLDQFYADQVDKPETYEIEKKALIDQYEPKINIEIINGGLFYLASPI
ncbi:hypothetical protein BLX87_09650 [Bacillus sp. VT-16-64]|nr:hypothetical protein BLX87_09650 [Bacillus sp. VT-16-64]